MLLVCWPHWPLCSRLRPLKLATAASQLVTTRFAAVHQHQLATPVLQPVLLLLQLAVPATAAAQPLQPATHQLAVPAAPPPSSAPAAPVAAALHQPLLLLPLHQLLRRSTLQLRQLKLQSQLSNWFCDSNVRNLKGSCWFLSTNPFHLFLF